MENPFNKMTQRYDSWFDRYKNAYLSELYAYKKLIPEKGIGLEIGVGTGRFASKLGIEIGVDISVPMMRLAAERGILCVKGRAEKLPFIDRSFDYALITTSICFFKFPVQALEEANRVLKNGGKLILGFIEKNSFLGKKYMTKKSPFYKKAKFFSINEIKRLITSTGFKITKILSTLKSDPSEMQHPQKSIKGLKGGAFIVLYAIKEG